MNMNRTLAQQIVDAVYEVVKQDINLINKKGIIIASTNPSRIDSFHEAGYEAVKRREPIFVESSQQFLGAQPGVNYPITIEDVTVAAIGITGNCEEVQQFGFLVTKITEVFLKEQQLKEQLHSKKRQMNYLIQSLITNEVGDEDQFINNLTSMGFDLNKEYAAVSIKINSLQMEKELNFLFDSKDWSFFMYVYPNEFVLILDENQLKQLLSLKVWMTEQYKGKLTVGIGTFTTIKMLFQSYENAKLAGKYAKSANQMFTHMDQLDISIILGSLPENRKQQFVKRIFSKLKTEDIALLKVYFEHELSLKETADLLNIHKNTLQYRLDKIWEYTNYNPRKFRDGVILYLGILLNN